MRPGARVPRPAGTRPASIWRLDPGFVVDGFARSATGATLVHAHAPAASARGGSRADAAWSILLDEAGRERWRAPCPVGYGRGLALAMEPEDRAWILGPGATGGLAVELDLANGAEQRRVELPVFDRARVCRGIALGARADAAFACDLDAGALLWERRREGERLGALAGSRGLVALARWREERAEGDLLLLDVLDGELRARCSGVNSRGEAELDALGERLFVAEPAAPDDLVGDSLRVCALSLAETSAGLELWSARVHGAGELRPPLARDGALWLAPRRPRSGERRAPRGAGSARARPREPVERRRGRALRRAGRSAPRVLPRRPGGLPRLTAGGERPTIPSPWQRRRTSPRRTRTA